MTDQLDNTEEETIDGVEFEQDETLEVDQDEEESNSESNEDKENDQEESDGDSNSGYLEISDPKIKARVDQLTREKWDERRENEALKKQIDELKAAKSSTNSAPEEVKAPDFDMYIDDPDEAARQQQKREEYLLKKADYDREQSTQKETQKTNDQEKFDGLVKNYNDNIDRLGIDRAALQNVAESVSQAAGQDVTDYLLGDPDGPAKVAMIGADINMMIKISEMSPLQAVGFIENSFKSATPPKKRSNTPPPPAKVKGSRNSGSVEDGTLYE